MIALVSSPNDAGHVVVVRLPDGCRLRVDFIDEDDARDLTDWVADLVVLGLAVRHELDTDQTVEPAEEVEVCSITFDVLDPSASFTYLHLPSSRAVEMSVADAVDLIRLGIGTQITAGVAAEAADVPDDASGAEDPFPPSTR